MGWPNAHTLSPSTYDTVPMAPKLMSPLEYPTPTAEPGRSVCTGNDPSGPAGAASTVSPRLPPALASAPATGPLSPETVSGTVSGLAAASRRRHFAASAPPRAARAAVPRAAAVLPGGSTGVARIDSIGVASAVLLPYSPIDSEIAPMFRLTPSESVQ